MASSQAPRPRFWFAPLAARSTAAPPPDPAPLAPRTPFIRPMFAPARQVPPASPPATAPAPAPAPTPPSQSLLESPPKTTPVPLTANPPPTTSTPMPAPAPAPLQPVAPRTPLLGPLFAQATVNPPEPQVAQPTPTPPQTIPIPTPAPPQQTPQAPAPAPAPRTPFLRPMFTQSPQPTPIPTTNERPSSPVVTTLVPPRPTTPTATPLVPQWSLPAATIVPPSTQPTSPPVQNQSLLQQSPPPKPISPSLSSQRITPKEIEPIKPTLIKTISPTPTTVTRNPSSPPPPLTLPPAVQYKSIQEKFPPEPEQKNITEKEIGEHAKGYNPKPTFAKTLFNNGKPTEKGHNQKKTPSSESDQEQGMRIITIAGENRGAVMELSSPFRQSTTAREGNTKPMRAFTNSNVQGVNNSIMFNSSCTHHDPGVHLSLIRKPAAMETSKDHKSSSNA